MLVLTIGLWREVNHANTTGVGEGAKSLVTSPFVGRLMHVMVNPYQVVQQGDPIAVVQPVDTRAGLDLWRGEMDLMRLRMQPSAAEQNAMAYERLRLELAVLKSELAIARVNLQRAENELARNTPLYREKLVSEDVYDLSLQTRNALAAEVEQKSEAVAMVEARMKKLQALGDPEYSLGSHVNGAMVERLDAMRSVVASNWAPVVLEAPITGMVGAIWRQAGENVVEGEPLVAIYSLYADHVVAYLRQPYVVEPSVGLKAKITSRNRDRTVYETEVTHVGARLEVITNQLAYIKPGALVDTGLPVIMDLPPHSRIRAGEVVDVLIENPQPRTFSLWDLLRGQHPPRSM